MSAYRFDIEFADGQAVQRYDLDAADREAAEYEAEYVLDMFPTRLHERQGRLYDVSRGETLLTVIRGEVRSR